MEIFTKWIWPIIVGVIVLIITQLINWRKDVKGRKKRLKYYFEQYIEEVDWNIERIDKMHLLLKHKEDGAFQRCENNVRYMQKEAYSLIKMEEYFSLLPNEAADLVKKINDEIISVSRFVIDVAIESKYSTSVTDLSQSLRQILLNSEQALKVYKKRIVEIII